MQIHPPCFCGVSLRLICCRAILLDGFQKIGLRHRPLRQAYAHRILMHTHAEDLSELKSYLDDGPDYHTTFKLLYSDFQVTTDALPDPGCAVMNGLLNGVSDQL